MITCFIPLYNACLILWDHFFSLIPHCSSTSYCTIIYFHTKRNQTKKNFPKLLHLTFLTSRPFSNTLFGLLSSSFHHILGTNVIGVLDFRGNSFVYYWRHCDCYFFASNSPCMFILHCQITISTRICHLYNYFSLYHYLLPESIVWK